MALGDTIRGIGGIATGIQQRRQAKRMQERDPRLTINRSTIEGTGAARRQAMATTAAGQNRLENKLGASTARSVRNIQEGSSSASDLTAGVIGAARSEMEGLADIQAKAAQERFASQGMYQSALKNQAEEEQNIQDLQTSKDIAHNIKKERLAGAATQNIWGGAAQLGDAQDKKKQQALDMAGMFVGGGMR